MMYDYNQDQNVGTEAASYAPDAVRVTGKVINKVTKKTASEAHKKTKKIIKKRIQKQMQKEFQKQQAKATADATKETVKVAAETAKKVGEAAAKAAKEVAAAVKEFVEELIAFLIDNPVALIVLAVIIVVGLMYHCIKMDLLVLFGSIGEPSLGGCYTAYEEDILGVNSDYTKLEKELKKTLDNIQID